MLNKILGLTLSSAMMIGAAQAFADYPERNVTLIVPFGPGGGTDITARTILPYIEKYLGGDIVIQNVPGGGGEIGTTECMLAEADGYTLCTFNVPNPLINMFMRETRYSLDDFEPIANLVNDRSIIAVLADSPFKTAQDLFDHAKAHPQELLFGSSGVGSNNHLEILMYQDQTGADFTIVHADGGGANRNNLLGGHVDVTATSITDLTQFILSGEVRALCLHGEDRMEQFPELQTCAEQGFNWNEGSARGIVAPTGTPAEIIAALENAVQQALADPELQAEAAEKSLPLQFMSSEEHAQFLKESATSVGALWDKYGSN